MISVKAANNEATEVEALNNEVAVKKATYPQKSKTKKALSWQAIAGFCFLLKVNKVVKEHFS